MADSDLIWPNKCDRLLLAERQVLGSLILTPDAPSWMSKRLPAPLPRWFTDPSHARIAAAVDEVDTGLASEGGRLAAVTLVLNRPPMDDLAVQMARTCALGKVAMSATSGPRLDEALEIVIAAHQDDSQDILGGHDHLVEQALDQLGQSARQAALPSIPRHERRVAARRARTAADDLLRLLAGSGRRHGRD